MKPSTEGNAAALLVSVALHAALLVLPIGWRLHAPVPSVTTTALPNSVAMVGNSIEVEAPTPELAAAPAAPAAEPPTPEPVDVNALPPEPARAPEPDAAPAPVPALPQARVKPASKPKPKPATPRSPVDPSAAAAPSSASAAGADTATSGPPAAGTFGQEGLPPGVRRLGYAFARSIPPATRGDAAWRELPAGHVGTIRIELEVDANNHLGAVKRWQARAGEPAPPAVLERLVERALILMRSGQFALTGSNDPGSERLVIDVEVRDEAPEGEGDANVVQIKFDAANPGQPYKAYFRYGTGRAVEAKVTTVRSGK